MPGQRPPAGSLAPKTKVTLTRRHSSQIGQGSLVGRPTLRAAREQLGVGVADVDLHGAAPLDVADDPIAHQAVLDPGRDVGADRSP